MKWTCFSISWSDRPKLNILYYVFLQVRIYLIIIIMLAGPANIVLPYKSFLINEVWKIIYINRNGIFTRYENIRPCEYTISLPFSVCLAVSEEKHFETVILSFRLFCDRVYPLLTSSTVIQFASDYFSFLSDQVETNSHLESPK